MMSDLAQIDDSVIGTKRPCPVFMEETDLELADEEKIEEAPYVNRIVGKKYLLKGEIRIWTGNHFYCEHNRQQSQCGICNKPKKPVTETLDITHPHLASEWMEDRNGPMSDYTHGSNKNVFLKCPKDHEEQGRIDHLTTQLNRCRECYDLEHLVVDAEARSILRNNPRVGKIDTVAISDATEKYVFDLLVKQNCFPDVENIGSLGDKTDIIVTLHSGEKKSLQIKTLSKQEGNNSVWYTFTNDKEYDPNMLIAMVNKERTCFALQFYKNLHQRTVSITMSKISGTLKDTETFKDLAFTEENLFVNKLVQLIANSCNYVKSVSKNGECELEMLMSLEQICKDNNFTYRRNDTNGNAIDCFINEKPCQAKATSYRTSEHLFSTNTSKNAGLLNGKQTKKPYSVDDGFDFLIVEVKDKEKKNTRSPNIYVIPKQELVKQKILSTATQPGTTSLSVACPETRKPHWTSPFLNRFDLFVSNPTE